MKKKIAEEEMYREKLERKKNGGREEKRILLKWLVSGFMPL